MEKENIRIGDVVRLMLLDATLIEGEIMEIEADYMLVDETFGEGTYTVVEFDNVAVLHRNKRRGESIGEDSFSFVAVI